MNVERKNKRGTRPGQEGFTAVEIAAVVFLILFCIVPAAAVIARSLSTGNDEVRLTHCAFLAQMKIEEIRARASCYSSKAVGGCPAPDSVSNFQVNFSQTVATCALPTGFTNYKCTIDTNWRDNADTNLGGYRDQTNDTGGIKEIQVRVWYDTNTDNLFNNDEPGVFLETQISQRAPDWGYRP